jgi:hypothetical protein
MAGITVVDVAKKKSDPERKPMVVQIRGSAEWKAWAEGLAEKDGDTLAKLVERALRKWAKDAGYPDPPKR